MDEDLGLQNADVGVSADVAVDIDVMKIYLEKLLVLLLGADQSDLNASLFSFPDSTERLRRFAIDAQTPALYILKETDSNDGCKYFSVMGRMPMLLIYGCSPRKKARCCLFFASRRTE